MATIQEHLRTSREGERRRKKNRGGRGGQNIFFNASVMLFIVPFMLLSIYEDQNYHLDLVVERIASRNVAPRENSRESFQKCFCF